jgi:hypothetical protein
MKNFESIGTEFEYSNEEITAYGEFIMKCHKDYNQRKAA